MKRVDSSGQVTWNVTVNSFENITAIIDGPNCTIERLLNASNFSEALKRQHAKLVFFVNSNIVTFAKIAMNIIPNDKSSLALRLLVTQIPAFSPKVSQNTDFIEYMSKFLFELKDFSIIKLRNYCLTMQFFIKLTNGNFLLQFTNGADLFIKLLEYEQYLCIYDLINYITSDGHPLFTKYLETINATNILWDHIKKFRNDRIKYKFLTNVMSSISLDSEMLLFIADSDKFSIIFDDAVQTKDKYLSNSAMELIYEMCSHCDESESEDSSSLYQLVFMFLFDHLDQLSTFIADNSFFSSGKLKAIEIINGLLSIKEEMPQSVLDAAGSLFSQIFEYPLLSPLHCGCLSLFTVLSSTEIEYDFEDFLTKFDVRNKIVHEFDNKSSDKQYYGHLYKITELILENKSSKCVLDYWIQYIKGPFTEMQKIINSNYGGDVPSRIQSMTGFDDRYI